MPIIKAEVRLNYATGLPGDVAVNTFHFNSDGTGSTASLMLELVDFYNVAQLGATNPLRYYISNIVARTTDACEIFLYEVGTPGPPIDYSTFTLGASGNATRLPLEVALCASYAGTTPGVPSARQRGRVFIGPLTQQAVQATGQAPVAALIDSLAGAAEVLADAPVAGFTWSVYSRVDNAAYGITHGWVDDEFDTQRRRQIPASTRQTWVV